jgi:hypothetical protein
VKRGSPILYAHFVLAVPDSAGVQSINHKTINRRNHYGRR